MNYLITILLILTTITAMALAMKQPSSHRRSKKIVNGQDRGKGTALQQQEMSKKGKPYEAGKMRDGEAFTHHFLYEMKNFMNLYVDSANGTFKKEVNAQTEKILVDQFNFQLHVKSFEENLYIDLIAYPVNKSIKTSKLTVEYRVLMGNKEYHSTGDLWPNIRIEENGRQTTMWYIQAYRLSEGYIQKGNLEVQAEFAITKHMVSEED